jgi:hypothetical protein
MSTVERTVMLNIPVKIMVPVGVSPEVLRQTLGNRIAEVIHELEDDPIGDVKVYSFSMDVKSQYDQLVVKDDQGTITSTYYQKGA